MRRNAITTAPLIDGKSENYIDLIHFRPSVGVRLFRVMAANGHDGAGAALGTDLAAR